MNIEDEIKRQIHELKAQHKNPMTILMPVEMARKMNLPTWTKTLFGLKLVINYNFEELKVVPHVYQTVLTKKTDEVEEKPSSIFKIQ